jgi:hypothetical protein
MSEKSAALFECLIVKAAVNGRRTYGLTAQQTLVHLSNRSCISVAGLARGFPLAV